MISHTGGVCWTNSTLSVVDFMKEKEELKPATESVELSVEGGQKQSSSGDLVPYLSFI